MKILHVVPSYLPAYRYGGPILSVHSMNKWLVRAGGDVTVYTTNVDGRETLNVPLGKEVLVDGVKVWYFPVSFPRTWTYSRELHRTLNKRAGDFDVVHITSVFLAASTLGARAAMRHKKPYIISPRGSLMKEPLARKSAWKKKIYLSLIERKNLADAAAIHFTDVAEREEYVSAGFPLRQAIIIPNGLDPEEFQMAVPAGVFRKKWNIAPETPIVLFLSRLNWKKGLDTLIPAFAEVLKKEPKAVLVLAGPDDEGYKKEIENMIGKVNLRMSDILRMSDVPNIVFTGMLLGNDKISAFKESNVFVLSSYSENFGMVVLEAMHMGLPVVITPEVGIAPEVARGGAGLVVPKNKTAVAGAILQILKNERKAALMGEAGKRLVENNFAPARVAEQFIRAYTEMIKA